MYQKTVAALSELDKIATARRTNSSRAANRPGSRGRTVSPNTSIVVATHEDDPARTNQHGDEAPSREPSYHRRDGPIQKKRRLGSRANRPPATVWPGLD